MSVCEDVWNDRDFWSRQRYHIDPIDDLATAGVSCVVNMSASPFTIGKQRHREAMLAAIARKYGVPVIYVNQAGGADELVFDGRSCAFAAGGELMARAAAFAPDVLVVDLEQLAGRSGPGAGPARLAPDDFAPASEVWRALVLGVRDYVAKSGFERALLGLSGGIDSALVAAVAAEALGPQNVLAVLMPSPYSSPGSVTDAQVLADGLALRTVTLPIDGVMGAFDRALSPVFAGRPADVTEENIQARIRGNFLMALSNKFDSLLLTTGNKSELAVGYCTIYGDMSGGLAVISDVPKTMVYAVARWLNEERGARGHSPGDPREGSLGRAAPGSDRPGQPAALRRARRHPRTADRGTSGRRRDRRTGLRSAHGRARRAPGGRQRVQAQAGGARHQGHRPGVRHGLAHADRHRAA